MDICTGRLEEGLSCEGDCEEGPGEPDWGNALCKSDFTGALPWILEKSCHVHSMKFCFFSL